MLSRSWAFQPPRDTFSPESLMDLRPLNEKVAGESGFVRLSPDGNDFVLGNGKLWDIAAGALLVTEASGVVTSPGGGAAFPLDVARYAGEDVPILAGRPAAHARLMREATTG